MRGICSVSFIVAMNYTSGNSIARTINDPAVNLTWVEVRSSSEEFLAGNYYDILNILVHEGMHCEQRNLIGLSQWEKDVAELQAYSAMVHEYRGILCCGSYAHTYIGGV